MNQRKQLTAAGASLGMLLLILDSRCALESAQDGMELCIRTVIPSLFPFLFLSGLATVALWGNCGWLLKLAAAAVGIPRGGEVLFLAGFLGGYPAGAAAVGSSYRSGHLNRETANRLLAFCSNAGPAFLFGMIAPQFPKVWMAWCLWGIHILSAALVGTVLPCPEVVQAAVCGKTVTIKENMRATLSIMATVCGWILLFRILIGFLDRWILWLLPETVRVVVWGMLELSNGCCSLQEIGDVYHRFIAAAFMVSFGGICVALQTASVLSGLSMKHYIGGKLMQALFSVLLAAAFMQGWWIWILPCAVMVLFPKYRKNSSSIPSASIV